MRDQNRWKYSCSGKDTDIGKFPDCQGNLSLSFNKIGQAYFKAEE